ncbi:hypothetical protein [Streptomyces sp. T028]|uniref:hypothetical protein n=1 Tax=Streptomyces sp. T028 TaxID=3394379 RepID=UPI003A8678F6
MHTTPTRLRHTTARTACAAALALLAAGCSQASADARTGGCRADGRWSERERAAWLRTAVTFRGTADGAGPSYADASVVVRAPRTGDARPLCQPLAVQIEFWTFSKETGLSSVLRSRIDTDGGRTRTVGFPTGLPADQDGVCAGVLVAAYVGAPLTTAELPDTAPDLTDTADGADAADTNVPFRTARIGAYRLLPPSDPAACAADRTGGGSPSPTPTGATGGSPGWDAYHP